MTAATGLTPIRTIERQARIDRTLQLVQRGHGQTTSAIITRLTGWTQRSTERYLVELESAELAERGSINNGREQRWAITPAGMTHLRT